ncbi:MAG: YbjN domain-containing protein [Nitriliruptorales bacterium]|nr:YbjN domain-containing protein [Nitriliruptorales bacterium]
MPDVDVGDVIDAWFAQQDGLDVERMGEDGWLTVLHGERKRAIPVYLGLGDHTLVIESFFMAAPDERHDEVYRYLLQRNLRTYTLRFAVYDSGDLMLVGVLPRHAVTSHELDRTLGQLLTVADETYWPAIRLGFTSYIEREQTWREKVGLRRNPIS